MSVNSKMTAIADAIRDKTGRTELLTLDDIAINLNLPYIVNVSSDTVTPETLLEGTIAHDATGNLIIGIAKPGPTIVDKLYFKYTGIAEVLDNDILRLLSSGTLTFLYLEKEITTSIDLFLVGGGGGGGTSYTYWGNTDYHYYGGGGGGGYVFNINTPINLSQSYNATIGAGGSVGSSGGTTSILGFSSSGGGPGGSCTSSNYSQDSGKGGAGGSGGGGGGYYAIGTSGTIYGNISGGLGGTNGSNGVTARYTGGIGGGNNTHEFGDNSRTLFASGGQGGGYSHGNVAGSANTGNGGGGNCAGGSGIISIRFPTGTNLYQVFN